MIGQYVPSLAVNTPAGYLECNGQTINRTSYPKFFEHMGITGDTYTLPNLNIADGYTLGHAGTSTFDFRAHENGTNGELAAATIQEHEHLNNVIETPYKYRQDAGMNINMTISGINTSNGSMTVNASGGAGNDDALLVKVLIGVE